MMIIIFSNAVKGKNILLRSVKILFHMIFKCFFHMIFIKKNSFNSLIYIPKSLVKKHKIKYMKLTLLVIMKVCMCSKILWNKEKKALDEENQMVNGVTLHQYLGHMVCYH